MTLPAPQLPEVPMTTSTQPKAESPFRHAAALKRRRDADEIRELEYRDGLLALMRETREARDVFAYCLVGRFLKVTRERAEDHPHYRPVVKDGRLTKHAKDLTAWYERQLRLAERPARPMPPAPIRAVEPARPLGLPALSLPPAAATKDKVLLSKTRRALTATEIMWRVIVMQLADKIRVGDFQTLRNHGKYRETPEILGSGRSPRSARRGAYPAYDDRRAALRACRIDPRPSRAGAEAAVTALVTLVRHGRTAHNAAGRFQGWADVPLDGHGHAQARRLALRLAAHPVRPVRVYASDLKRASQTADHVAEALGVAAVPVPALREIHIGAWEALTFAEIEARDEARFRAWPIHGAPGGESLTDVARRVRGVFDALDPGASEHVVVVTHGVAITGLLCDLLGWDAREAWSTRRGLHDNTAITTLRRGRDGAWASVTLACAAHLEG